MEQKKGMRRSDMIDVAKGIGILSVVWAHAKGPYSGYIYQFHMPLFFLLSGYLYSRRKPVGAYAAGKFKTLYLPFVVWNIAFTLMKAFTGLQKFSRSGLVREIGKILLTLSKDGRFLGATWFLGALFAVSVLYRLLDTSIKDEKRAAGVLLGAFGAAAVFGFCVTLPAMLSRTLILSLFFAAGRWVRCEQERLEKFGGPLLAVLCAVGFWWIGGRNSANMGKNQYSSPALFVVGAMMASYVTVYLSVLIDRWVPAGRKALAYLGRKSLPIVIWQFVVFRAVIALQLALEGISLSKTLDYYPCYKTGNGWWMVYTIVGLAGSILLGEVLSAMGRGAAAWRPASRKKA